MAPHRRVARAFALGTVLTVLLAGCQPDPQCLATDCGTRDAQVVGRAADGSTWRTVIRDAAGEHRSGPQDRWTESASQPDQRDKPLLRESGGHVVVDGCRAVHVLDPSSGRVVLETEALGRAWAVGHGLAVGVTDGALVAVSLDGGHRAWTITPEGEPGDAATPTVVGVTPVDTGFAIAWTDRLTVVSPDGVELDPTDVEGPVIVPPVPLDGHTLFVATGDGTVWNVDTTTGRVAWTVRPAGGGSFTPASPGRPAPVQVVPLGDDVLVSWAGPTGETVRLSAGGRERWRADFALKDGLVAAPDATLLPTTELTWSVADAATGEDVYTRPANAPTDLPLALAEGLVRGGSGAPFQAVRRWDPASSTPRQGAPAWGALGFVLDLAADQILMDAPEGGGVVAVDPVGESISWTLPLDRLQPPNRELSMLRGVSLPDGAAAVLDLPPAGYDSERCDRWRPMETVTTLPSPRG